MALPSTTTATDGPAPSAQRPARTGIAVAIDGATVVEVPLPVLSIFADGPAEATVSAMRAVEEALLTRMTASMPSSEFVPLIAGQ